MADPTGWSHAELVAFDLETTGLDRFADMPVSYALVHVGGGVVVGTDTALVDPGRPIPAEATAVHGISDERARAEGMPMAMAVSHLVRRLVDASRRGVPVVGMKLDFDLSVVDSLCRRYLGRGLATEGFAGPVLDVLVLDRRADRYRPGPRTLSDLCCHYEVTLEAAHDAAADAAAAAGVAVALCARHPWLAQADLGTLHTAQVRWHRRWATSYDRWRRSEGLGPLDPDELSWPIARCQRMAGLVALAS